MPTDPTPTPADIEAARDALYSDGVAGMPDRVARALATARTDVEQWRAERVEPDLWLAGGIEHDDEEIADEGGPVTTIASLPRVGGGGS